MQTRWPSACLCAGLLASCATISVGPDVVFHTPADCAMTAAPSETAAVKRNQCSFKAPDGSTRKISLMIENVPPERLTPDDLDRLAREPRKTMADALTVKERSVTVGVTPGPGQNLITATSRVMSSARTPPGFDVCLRYEFDFSDALPTGGRVRIDNTGLRCMMFDPARQRLTEVMLEYIAGHETASRRLPGFGNDARVVLDSLRVE